MRTFLESSTILFLLLTGLWSGIIGCAAHDDGLDGPDGVIVATFYYSEDVIAIDRSNLSKRDANSKSVGQDGIGANYFLVENLNGSFSWTTDDNQIYTHEVAWNVNKGEPGTKARPPGNIREYLFNPCGFSGEDGKPGKPIAYVIKLEGSEVTIFDNRCLTQPFEPCEETTPNSNNPETPIIY